jgi:hypothetical protein
VYFTEFKQFSCAMDAAAFRVRGQLHNIVSSLPFNRALRRNESKS